MDSRMIIRQKIMVAFKKLKVLDGETIDNESKKQLQENVLGKFTLEILYSQLNQITPQQMSELDLSNNGIKEIQFTFDEILFPKLKLLILSNNKINSISFIRNLPRLKVLIFNNNKLKQLTCNDNNNGGSGGGIYYLKDLEYLDLSYNEMSDLSALQATPNLTELKILRLQNNKISKINFTLSLPKLYELDVSKNQIKMFDRQSFLVPNIITCFKAEDNLIKSLQNIESLQCLNKLFLNGNKVMDLIEIDKLNGMQFLEELTLYNTPLSRKNLYRQNVLKKLIKLRFLDHIEISMDEKTKLLMTDRGITMGVNSNTNSNNIGGIGQPIMQPLINIVLGPTDKRLIQSIDSLPQYQNQQQQQQQQQTAERSAASLNAQYQANSQKLHSTTIGNMYIQQALVQNSYQNSSYNSGQLQINAQKYNIPLNEDKNSKYNKYLQSIKLNRFNLDDLLTINKQKNEKSNQAQSQLQQQPIVQKDQNDSLLSQQHQKRIVANESQTHQNTNNKNSSILIKKEQQAHSPIPHKLQGIEREEKKISSIQNATILANNPTQEYFQQKTKNEVNQQMQLRQSRGKSTTARGMNGDFEQFFHNQREVELFPQIKQQRLNGGGGQGGITSLQQSRTYKQNAFLQNQQQQMNQRNGSRNQFNPFTVTPFDFYNYGDVNNNINNNSSSNSNSMNANKKSFKIPTSQQNEPIIQILNHQTNININIEGYNNMVQIADSYNNESNMNNLNSQSLTNFTEQQLVQQQQQQVTNNIKQNAVKVAQAYNVLPSLHSKGMTGGMMVASENDQERLKLKQQNSYKAVSSLNMAAFGSSIMKTERSNSVEQAQQQQQQKQK